MQASANAARIAENEKPKSKKFSLKTPYMKQGRVTQLVAETTRWRRLASAIGRILGPEGEEG